ncbi:MAG TPA: heavy metal translocating P-type ATPase [Terriglobales bacterium]|nr:heavy metal translocating P-type ATPase [Terriglobales bacterium]
MDPETTLPLDRNAAIALLVAAAIATHLVLRTVASVPPGWVEAPLWLALAVGGLPQLASLASQLWRREFGSDLLAGTSIVVAVLFGEYLVGAIIVLMLSGGNALERYASGRASSVLSALARRMPLHAHRQAGAELEDVPLAAIQPGDRLVVLPHEICPVDGTVLAGEGSMEEAYLTGEPFGIAKAPGSLVLSGAINGDVALTIRAEKLAKDSRYAAIMRVMEESAQKRPRLRRIADRLGAGYTPVALAVAAAAAILSGDPRRFLAVIVIATPCPLILAIPVAVIGAISLAARRAIVVKNPAALELIPTCRTFIFDKTGTLTYGQPVMSEILPGAGFEAQQVLAAAAGLERYSRHPLATAVVAAAQAARLRLGEVTQVSEAPGQGLVGLVAGEKVRITGRGKLGEMAELPPAVAGLECVVLIEDRYAGVFRFQDRPRDDSQPFIGHLRPRHGVSRMLLVSGDREAAVRYLADQVGITEVYADQTPEQKVAIVEAERRRAPTLFVGDGINDAPALLAATVGVALGASSDIVSEAADAVVLTPSLGKVDELVHIGQRMRRIALQSAIGGMAASVVGMAAASAGLLPPLSGAVLQEVIDILAVVNAVRVALPPRALKDF